MKLALLLGGLVAMNVYVFFYKGGTSLRDVKKAVKEARVNGADAGELTWDSVFETRPQRPTGRAETMRGRLKDNESVGTLLARLEVTPADADEAMRALGGVLDWRKIKGGVPYRVERAADHGLVGLELHVLADQRVVVERGPDGKLVAHVATR